jgi:hypothetical protein
VAGGWKRLHDEEIRDSYASPSIIRVIKSRTTGCAGHVASMAEMRNVYNIVVGKHRWKRLLGSPRLR